ncbi:MAG: low-specificity L-threonine aldolase [Halioglobus sp.]
MAAELIDLRSDTVTQPSAEMRRVMASATVGDDVYGEDPTVNLLEDFAADLLGKEAALYCPTGTQSNLVGLMAHCGRGDEYIVGDRAHTYLYEGGGAAVLGSIQPQTIPLERDGTMDLSAIEGAIKPEDVHYARTRLICLENTHAGNYLPTAYQQEVRSICDKHKVSLHLDGARLFNACVAQGLPAADIVKPYDTVSICLSKGLGAPIGSLLVGETDLIKEARRWRKMLGGGMRQAGIVASAGLYALKNNVQRLEDDHQNAKRLATHLMDIDGVLVVYSDRQTNMVHVSVDDDFRSRLQSFSKKQGIVLPEGAAMRLVMHMDVSSENVQEIIKLFQDASTSV